MSGVTPSREGFAASPFLLVVQSATIAAAGLLAAVLLTGMIFLPWHHTAEDTDGAR